MKDWQTKKLGEICTISIGKTPSRGNKKFWDVGKETNNIWLSIRDLNSTVGKEVFDSHEYISNSGAGLFKIVPKGTLLVSFKLTLGRLAFAGTDLYTNEAIAALEIKDDEGIDKQYLYYYLIFFDWDAETKGDTKVKGKTLNKAKLKAINVVLPPLPEQKRLVALLDELFEKLEKAKENAKKNLVNSKELFDSYLQDIFINSGHDWDEEMLNEICEVKDGTHDSPKYIEEGIPFVTQKNIRAEGLSLENTKYITEEDHHKFYKRSNVTFGDILISMIGANRGMACMVNDKRIFSIKNVGLIKKSERINGDYLLYFLKSPLAMRYVEYMSKGGAQEFVGLTALRSFPIPLPSRHEQKSIVSKLDSLSSETQRLESIYQQKTTHLNELKQSILHQAFAGKL